MGNNVGNQTDCARYAEVSTVAGTHWTDLGVQPGGAPVIFKLDVDANLTQDGDPYTSIYRNYDQPNVPYCLLFLTEFLIVDSCNISQPDHYVMFDNTTEECLPYGIDVTFSGHLNVNSNVTGFISAENGLIVRTPESPCSDCRSVSDATAGTLQGDYTLKDFYSSACGANTDMCLYEKDGLEYCFEENGLYDIDFTCSP